MSRLNLHKASVLVMGLQNLGLEKKLSSRQVNNC